MMDFYRNKRVFVTGHTGFKGSWLCRVLHNFGAIVTGYALEPGDDKSLFRISKLEDRIDSVIGDIRDFNTLKNAILKAQPEIVIHMAAQPLVIESYRDPVYTYETNVMGTVYLMEALRDCPCVRSILNVTTDKVYRNEEREEGYREEEYLDGFDPYSNSKSCSELVTNSYRNSFYFKKRVAVSTARSGNVIGGGDFSDNRIIPDCIRAAINQEEILVRNPNSIRPYQHVLEPVMAYLMIIQKQYEMFELQGSYNVGPKEDDCITTSQLVSVFCSKWGDDMKWSSKEKAGPHEAGFLKLDCLKIQNTLGWKPCWGIEKAVEMTVNWMKAYLVKEDMEQYMNQQISEFWSSHR